MNRFKLHQEIIALIEAEDKNSILNKKSKQSGNFFQMLQ